jgi:L-2-hydroxyglutarate oxidase
MNIGIDFNIIPFRGEYYKLGKRHNTIVKHLIYPIPDPDLPFLGVHLTRMIDGGITVGPNAVLGLKREGYGGLNISPKDMLEIFGFPGFWKMFRDNFSAGIVEFRDSLYKPGYLKRVRKYCPEVELDELMSYPAGIRAQAVLNDGTLVHDFLFASSERSLHVCNAPSPAATSALPIADYLAGKSRETFSL